MGYDVWVDGEFTMKAEQLKKAIPIIVKAVAEKKGNGDESLEDLVNYGQMSAILTQDFDNGDGVVNPKALKILPKLIESALEDRYECIIDDLGNLTILVGAMNSFRNPDDEEWFFRAITPFCDAGDSSISFSGEDGYQWRWEIANEEFKVVDSDVIFGNDVNAPKVVEKLIKLIYYTEDPRRHQPGQSITAFFDFNDPEYEEVVERIEGILRESGFGPQAGKTELERLADV